jgi:hypothetical protein
VSLFYFLRVGMNPGPHAHYHWATIPALVSWLFYLFNICIATFS